MTLPLLSSGHAQRGESDVLCRSDSVDLALGHAYVVGGVKEGSGIVKPTCLPVGLHILAAVLSVVAVFDDAPVLDSDNSVASDVRDCESALETLFPAWSTRDIAQAVLASDLRIDGVTLEVVNACPPCRRLGRRLL